MNPTSINNLQTCKPATFKPSNLQPVTKCSRNRYFALLFLSILVCFTGCKSDKKEEAAPEKIIKVTITDVADKEMAEPVNTSGILSSKELINLSFKISGIIKRIYVDEGNTVKRGDLLAQLELAEISAKLNQAQTAFNKALNDFERVKNLYEDSVVTIEQLQNTQSQLQLAESDVEIARFNFNHASIIAPASGRITKRLAGENELVSMGTPILTLASTEENLIIRVGLTEKDILKLHIGDTAEVEFDAYPGLKFMATVQEIAAALDMKSGTYEVELSLVNADRKLLNGFSASVVIFPSATKRYKLVPIESLVKASGLDAYVFTLSEDGSTAVRIPVRVAFIMGDHVAIASGLDGVDKVIKVGTEFLHTHSKVEVIKE